jgi:hypothetical protein
MAHLTAVIRAASAAAVDAVIERYQMRQFDRPGSGRQQAADPPWGEKTWRQKNLNRAAGSIGTARPPWT